MIFRDFPLYAVLLFSSTDCGRESASIHPLQSSTTPMASSSQIVADSSSLVPAPSTSSLPTLPPVRIVEGKEHSAEAGVFAKACELPCADDTTQMQTWTDRSGNLSLVAVQGSLRRCSHPPLVFLDGKGKEVFVIPENPIVPNSQEQKEIEKKKADIKIGLKKSASVSCGQVKH